VGRSELSHRDRRSSRASQGGVDGLDDRRWCQSGVLVKGMYGFQGSFGGALTVP